MDISLSPELEKLIDERVQSGMYASPNEVIREGLRLLAEQEELRKIRLQNLKAGIAQGIESLDQGEGIAAEELFAELKEKNAAARRKP